MTQSPIRSKDRFLVFVAPTIDDAEIQEVVASIQSGWLGTGPKVERFERDFKAYKNAALHLISVLAPGIGPGA